MTALAHIAVVLTLAGAAQAAPLADAMGATIEAKNATSIPPNCTLNPWTHKYVCHKWPKGTTTRA